MSKVTLTFGIALAGLGAPIFVFFLFGAVGLVFSVADFISMGSLRAAPTIGMLNGGIVYAMLAAAISIPATLVLGLPLSYLAMKRRSLSRKVVLLGASISGSAILVVLAAIYLWRPDISLLLICAAIGGLGGLLNGYAFLCFIWHNNYFNDDAQYTRAG
jgi:hypothetical protein